ncbi:MAG: hypothetical protein WCK70_01030 [Chloroflexales bacterium]
MSDSAGVRWPRQRVGRRLGLTPYYQIVEQNEVRLRLDSLPEANRTAGYQLIFLGSTLILIAVAIIGSGVIASVQGIGFGVAAISAVLAGLLGSLGTQRAIGGYAVLTTHNQIIADATEGDLTFIQMSRVGKARRQSLAFAQIDAIRLRRRPLLVGVILRQMRPIIVLELLVGSNVWILDSAENGDDLQEIAAALHTVMGQEP